MRVVKITMDDDGRKVESPRWHYITDWWDADRTLCGGEVFGIGEGRAKYQEKEGNVTCPRCIAIIKELKAVKL